MSPLQRTSATPESRQRMFDGLMQLSDSTLWTLAGKPQVPPAPLKEHTRRDLAMKAMSEKQLGEMWGNEIYTVYVRKCGSSPFGEHYHISVRRNDREPVRDWRDMQQIKNAILGPEEEACELYPKESRVLDGVNQFPVDSTNQLWYLNEYAWTLQDRVRHLCAFVRGGISKDIKTMAATSRATSSRGTSLCPIATFMEQIRGG